LGFTFLGKVKAEHSFQEPIPNLPLLLSYLPLATVLQESRLSTEEFILAFWLRCELLPWQRVRVAMAMGRVKNKA